MNIRRLVYFIISLFCIKGLNAQNNTQVDLIINKQSETIETLSFFNIGQNIMFHEQAFSDTIHFEFSNPSDDAYNIWYANDQQQWKTQIWLGTGDVVVYLTISGVSLKVDSVIGAPLYYEVLSNSDSIKNIGEDKVRIEPFLMKSFIKHMTSPFSISLGEFYMRNFPNDKSKLKKLKIITDMQLPEVKSHWQYQGFYQRLLTLLGVNKLDLSKYTFFDETLDEATFTNGGEDYTVLDFWFTGCQPCVQQHKVIRQNIEEGILKKNVRFVGISIEKNQEDWKAYLKENQIPWDNFMENSYIDPVLSQDLGIISFPTYVLIDKDNNILGNFNSYNSLLDFLNT